MENLLEFGMKWT